VIGGVGVGDEKDDSRNVLLGFIAAVVPRIAGVSFGSLLTVH
jgi:hypothetical protein